MKIDRIPIMSAPALQDGRPWYDLACTDAGTLVIAAGNHAGKESTLAGSTHDLVKQIQGAVAAAAHPIEPGDTIAVVITLDGKLEVHPTRELAGEYHAHLGFYDPNTDTLQLLEFHDDTPAPTPVTGEGTIEHA